MANISITLKDGNKKLACVCGQKMEVFKYTSEVVKFGAENGFDVPPEIEDCLTVGFGVTLNKI